MTLAEAQEQFCRRLQPEFDKAIKDIRAALEGARDHLMVEKCPELPILEAYLEGKTSIVGLIKDYRAFSPDHYYIKGLKTPEHPMWVFGGSGEWIWVPDERVHMDHSDRSLRITFKNGDTVADTGITNEQVSEFRNFLERLSQTKAEANRRVQDFKGALDRAKAKVVRPILNAANQPGQEFAGLLFKRGTILHMGTNFTVGHLDQSFQHKATGKLRTSKIQLVTRIGSKQWSARAYTEKGTYVLFNFMPSNYLDVVVDFENLEEGPEET